VTRASFILLASLAWSCARAADPEPVQIQVEATTSLATAATIRTGQRVDLTLDVLGRGAWAQVPRLPDIDLPGCLALRVESQGMRLSETRDGEEWTGQRYTWILIPRRPGSFTLPALSLDVEVREPGHFKPTPIPGVKTAPLYFEVVQPEGTDGIADLVCTRKLTATQSWSPPPETWNVGDALTRTVTVHAEGLPGMVLPGTQAEPVTGLRPYPKTPRIDDKVDRGNLLAGSRREETTWILQSPGTWKLPDLHIRWWDLEKGALREEILPGKEITVAAPVGAPTGLTDLEAPEQEDASWSLWIWIICLAGLAAGLFLLRFLAPLLVARGRKDLTHRRASETATFRRFLRANRQDDAPSVLHHLSAWVRHPEVGGPHCELHTFLADHTDTPTTHAVSQLARRAVGLDTEDWDRVALAEGIRALHRDLAGQRGRKRKARAALPPINPERAEKP